MCNDMCHGNMFYQYGDTALHEASDKGHPAVAELLLRHGASHTCRNKVCIFSVISICRIFFRLYTIFVCAGVVHLWSQCGGWGAIEVLMLITMSLILIISLLPSSVRKEKSQLRGAKTVPSEPKYRQAVHEHNSLIGLL